MNLFELSAKLSLDSSAYMSGINTAKKTVGTFGKVAAATFAAGSAAFVAFSKNAVQTGAEFDTAMSQVAATMGVTTDEIANLRDFAKQMGATTKFSAVESAQALNYMALAGYDAEKSMKTLPTVLNLAAAGGMDLARASDMVTDAESALGLTSEQTAKMVDQMAKTASKSNTSVEQLGDAMLTIGGTAKFMAGGTDRLQTVLGLLADNGIKGAEAGTHLRNMLLKLSSPTKDGAGALNALGVQVFDASGNMRDMQLIMGDLSRAMQNLTEEQKVKAISDIFNARDLSAVNALLGTSEERWNELGSAIASAQGSAQKMADTQLDNLTGNVTIMKSAWEGLKIEFSEGLMPTLNEIVKKITGWLSNPKTMQFVHDLGEKTGALVTKIADWVEKIVPFIIDAVKTIWPVFKDVFGSISGLTSGIATKMFDAFKKILPKIADLVKKAVITIQKVIPPVLNFIKKIAPSLKTILDVVVKLAKTALPIVVNLVKKLAPVVENVVKFLSQIVKSVAPLLEKVLKFVGDVLGDIISDIADFVKSWGPAIVNVIKVISQVLSPLVDLLSGIHKVVNTVTQPIKDLLSGIGGAIGSFLESSNDIEERLSKFDKSAYAIEHVSAELRTLAEEYEENRQRVKATADAFHDLTDERNEYLKTQDEIQHIADLKAELDKLIDSEGRVNDENLERAKFITEELENLTGLEIQWNGPVIESYNQISEAIDNVMKKKAASKLLEFAEANAETARAELEELGKSIHDTQGLLDGYIQDEENAQKAVDESAERIEKLKTNLVREQAKERAARRKMEKMDVEGTYLSRSEEYEELGLAAHLAEDQVYRLSIALAKEQAVYDDRTASLEEYSGLRSEKEAELQEYLDIEQGYYNTLTNYESAYFDFVTGGYDAVIDTLGDYTSKRWETIAEERQLTDAEIAELKREMDSRVEAYKRAEQGYAENRKGFTAKRVEDAKKEADAMIYAYELAIVKGNQALLDEAKSLGVSFVNGFSAGIKAMAQAAAKQAKNMAQGAIDMVKHTLEIKSPSKVTKKIGQYFGEGFSEGILDEVKAVEDSVGYMSDSAVDAFGNPASEKYNHGTTEYRTSSMSRVEQLLQSILDNMGVDIVLEDGTIAGRVDRILGKTAMRKARGGA